jgi:hypothetical protein
VGTASRGIIDLHDWREQGVLDRVRVWFDVVGFFKKCLYLLYVVWLLQKVSIDTWEDGLTHHPPLLRLKLPRGVQGVEILEPTHIIPTNDTPHAFIWKQTYHNKRHTSSIPMHHDASYTMHDTRKKRIRRKDRGWHMHSMHDL